jgi:hypothetical protein
VLFFISWLVRTRSADHAVTTPMFVLEVVAVALSGVTAWLGGELVDRLGIGTDRDANPDAPGSLSHSPVGSGTRGRTAAAGRGRLSRAATPASNRAMLAPSCWVHCLPAVFWYPSPRFWEEMFVNDDVYGYVGVQYAPLARPTPKAPRARVRNS